jgi:thioredoxin-like negative regulator of GroEL
MVLLVLAWQLWFGGSDAGRVDREIPDALRSAVAQASALGMVLPVGEGVSDEEIPRYRAGGASNGDALEGALARLSERYERRISDDREVVCWLIAGYIASGKIATARAYVSQARVRYPEDPRLLVLAAVIAYRESDLASAEKHLRAALALDPDDAVAKLDLAILLLDLGNRLEAIEHLEAVRAQHADTMLGRRAMSLLDELDGS